MKDFLGQPIDVWDHVIFIAQGYRHLVKGKIIAKTNNFVRIKFVNTWNFDGKGVEQSLLQYPEQTVKYIPVENE